MASDMVRNTIARDLTVVTIAKLLVIIAIYFFFFAGYGGPPADVTQHFLGPLAHPAPSFSARNDSTRDKGP
jgi:hypothetical protein